MLKPNSVQLHHLFEGHLQLHRLQGGGAAAHRHLLQQLHRSQDHLRGKKQRAAESQKQRREWRERDGKLEVDRSHAAWESRSDDTCPAAFSEVTFRSFSFLSRGSEAKTKRSQRGISCHQALIRLCSLSFNQYSDKVAFSKSAVKLWQFDHFFKYIYFIYHPEILLFGLWEHCLCLLTLLWPLGSIWPHSMFNISKQITNIISFASHFMTFPNLLGTTG